MLVELLAGGDMGYWCIGCEEEEEEEEEGGRFIQS